MSAPVPVSARASVILPSGLWTRPDSPGSEVHRRRAILRPITGADEQALLRIGDDPLAMRVSLLLGRCLVTLEGEGVEDGAATTRRLTVGDREALLLHLRRLTFGNALDAVLECPRDECAAKMDLSLTAGDLLLPPADEPRRLHEVTVEGDGGSFTVRFRLPTGADQEDAAVRLRTAGGSAAVELLAARCLRTVIRPNGEAIDLEAGVEALPPAVLGGLSAAVAEADPQADLLLRLTCPECGEAFTSRFDAGAYLLAELAEKGDSLYRQVHGLALHYHWSETEILALTPGKRHLYLSLLADDLGAARAGSRTAGALA